MDSFKYSAPDTRLQQGGFNTPRKGKHNDKAHPPIHPTAHAANLAGDEKKVYEFIARRFLACCSKDAEGWQTTVDVEYGGEEFLASGNYPLMLQMSDSDSLRLGGAGEALS